MLAECTILARVLYGAGEIIMISVQEKIESLNFLFFSFFSSSRKQHLMNWTTVILNAAYRKNLFFFDEFSITNSFDRPFFPSSAIQAFSLVSASPLSAVVVIISYSVRRETQTQWITPGVSQFSSSYGKWLSTMHRRWIENILQTGHKMYC